LIYYILIREYLSADHQSTMKFISQFLALFLLVLTSMTNADTLSTGEDVTTFVEKKIAGSHVVIFAKTFCPYCKNAIRMLQDLRKEMAKAWTIDIIQLNEQPEDDGYKIQTELLTKTGRKSVPNIFIGGQAVGGNSDIVFLHERDLLVPKLAAGVAVRA